MSVQVFEKSILFPRPAANAFAWLESPGALERLTPPWENIRVIKPAAGLEDGTRVELEAKVGPFRTRWLVEHRDYQAGTQFRDVALSGPFSYWSHLHRVEAESTGECRLIDRIEYEPPLGALGTWVAGGFIRGKLERLFRHRHRVMAEDLDLARRYGAVRRLRILIAGASGFVGSALMPFLRSQGHEVVTLVRREARGPHEIVWAPGVEPLDPQALRGIDAVINLAGAGIAEGRWTESRKTLLRESRLQTTRTLVEAIEKAKHRPYVLVNASAIGAYGSRGDERLDEKSVGGSGFLAQLCEDWEATARVAEEWGVRTAMVRTGVVLSPEGGALAKLLPLFRLGVGGPTGDPKAWLSWISRDDLIGVIYHCLLDQRCRGPINAVAPQPVRQGEFARTLGRVLRRPAFLPAPSWALRLAFGEMAQETLLSSARVHPSGLQDSGFVFRHPQLVQALSAVLGASQPAPEESAGARRGSSRVRRR